MNSLLVLQWVAMENEQGDQLATRVIRLIVLVELNCIGHRSEHFDVGCEEMEDGHTIRHSVVRREPGDLAAGQLVV